MNKDYSPEDFPTDYSHPNALAGQFDHIEDRLRELEEKLNSNEKRGDAGGAAIYCLGSSLAVVLSWSRNASILWCIGHGLTSWIYVIYFAVTR